MWFRKRGDTNVLGSANCTNLTVAEVLGEELKVQLRAGQILLDLRMKNPSEKVEWMEALASVGARSIVVTVEVEETPEKEKNPSRLRSLTRSLTEGSGKRGSSRRKRRSSQNEKEKVKSNSSVDIFSGQFATTGLSVERSVEEHALRFSEEHALGTSEQMSLRTPPPRPPRRATNPILPFTPSDSPSNSTRCPSDSPYYQVCRSDSPYNPATPGAPIGIQDFSSDDETDGYEMLSPDFRPCSPTVAPSFQALNIGHPQMQIPRAISDRNQKPARYTSSAERTLQDAAVYTEASMVTQWGSQAAAPRNVSPRFQFSTHRCDMAEIACVRV